MRFSVSLLLSSFLLLSASGQALASTPEGPLIHKRQSREPSSGATPDASSDASPAPTSPSPTRTSPPGSTNSDASASRSQGRSSQASSTTRQKTTVDPRQPPGGVVIQTPITTSGSLYYKIGYGETITFGWNYTSLVISPTAVNVEAFCSSISQTYTIASNLSIATQSVLWDTGAFVGKKDQPPLAMGTYTLLIYDERSAVTAIPAAGRLSAFNGFKFGLYLPKGNIPLKDFECPSCNKNSAMTLDMVAIRMLALTSFIFTVSFGLFFSFVS